MNDPLALIAHAGIAKTVCEVDGLDGVQAQTQESGKIFNLCGCDNKAGPAFTQTYSEVIGR